MPVRQRAHERHDEEAADIISQSHRRHRCDAACTAPVGETRSQYDHVDGAHHFNLGARSGVLPRVMPLRESSTRTRTITVDDEQTAVLDGLGGRAGRTDQQISQRCLSPNHPCGEHERPEHVPQDDALQGQLAGAQRPNAAEHSKERGK